MKLVQRLFMSYMLVIVVILAALVVTVMFVGPLSVERATFQSMMGGQMGPPRQGNELREMPMMAGFVESIRANLRATISNGLLLAGLGALIAATLASWTISRRIVQPLQDLAHASQRIAAGHYDERLDTQDAGDDELGDMIHSFNRMAEALEATEALRQQLIADVSHELKTPLASIKGYMEGLQDGVIEATPETYELVHREADRLGRLVRDLQLLSRAEAHQLRLETAPCDARSIVESALAFLQPQFDGKGVTLEADVPETRVDVLADFDRARQVMLNVVGNALQYTAEGGHVRVELSREKGAARISVHDSGVGLDAKDLQAVFERFYRVDKSRARASGGSGIGLTIARHIVEEHGGRIWAESDGPGRGSTFHFTLPLA